MADRTAELMLVHYAQAINQIDDYFEYQHESDKDKERVMEIIDTLTKRLGDTI